MRKAPMFPAGDKLRVLLGNPLNYARTSDPERRQRDPSMAALAAKPAEAVSPPDWHPDAIPADRAAYPFLRGNRRADRGLQ